MKADRKREIKDVSDMDTASFRTASIQTGVMKGIPQGNNLLTQHFIFEKARLCPGICHKLSYNNI